ncbi:hypothetical protein [Flavobacterium sp. N1736]|nr:hypothetical protein [Flavobacterium sp. N1736]
MESSSVNQFNKSFETKCPSPDSPEVSGGNPFAFFFKKQKIATDSRK